MGFDRRFMERKKFDSPKCRTNYNIHNRFTCIESLTYEQVDGPLASKQRRKNMQYTKSIHYITSPIPIKQGKLGRSQQLNKSLVDYFISEYKDKNLGEFPKNNTGWKFQWDNITDHKLDELLYKVYSWYIKHVSYPRNYKNFPNQILNDLNITVDGSVWIQENKPGEGCPIHDHGTISKTSWVYYLDVGEDPSPLTFPQCIVNDYGEQTIVDYFNIPVYNDSIVMFPGFIPHMVYPSNTTRYVVAGNINDIIYEVNQ